MDGVRIWLQFQDVPNGMLRRTVGDPEFLQWLKREPLEQRRGIEYVSPHTLHITTLVQQENQRRKRVKEMSSQLTLSDPEDLELERMVDWARLTTTAQFYVKNKNNGLKEIGPTTPLVAKQKGWKSQKKEQLEIEQAKGPPPKKICTTVSSIPQWSKKSLKQHVRKVKENLTLLQQGKEEEAEVFVRNNT